ncbi:MAG: glutaredoxin family protein [Marinobacterium sp.]|nr:glutaredoxin family protein [Marinobacterium sp.]
MKTLVLMTTAGCHLCEVAEQLIVETLTTGCVVEAQDIAESDALIDQYGIRIPVLVCEQSGVELGWPFDQTQLAEFIAQLPEGALPHL